MLCRVCNYSIKEEYFRTKILGKYEGVFYLCPKCGALFPDDPYWLDEAYSNNQSVTDTDTGIMERNRLLTLKVSNFYRKEIKTGKVLDYGGGYGVLTRMLRDVGIDCVWYDKYTSNLFARGFEWNNGRVELLLMMEVFEHFLDPVEELRKAFSYSNVVILSTILYSSEWESLPPQKEDWWYYDFNSGQHIFFANIKTMQTIARMLDVEYYNINGLHVFSKSKINSMKIRVQYNNVLAKILEKVLFSYWKRREINSVMNDYLYLDRKKYEETQKDIQK